jgi:hypothetical protein
MMHPGPRLSLRDVPECLFVPPCYPHESVTPVRRFVLQSMDCHLLQRSTGCP